MPTPTPTHQAPAGPAMDAEVAKLLGIPERTFADPCPNCGESVRDCGGRAWCSRCGWIYSPYRDYSTCASADYEVLRHVRDKWRGKPEAERFAAALRKIWRERQTVAPMQFNDGDLPLRYEPGDYSRAALLAAAGEEGR